MTAKRAARYSSLLFFIPTGPFQTDPEYFPSRLSASFFLSFEIILPCYSSLGSKWLRYFRRNSSLFRRAKSHELCSKFLQNVLEKFRDIGTQRDLIIQIASRFTRFVHFKWSPRFQPPLVVSVFISRQQHCSFTRSYYSSFARTRRSPCNTILSTPFFVRAGAFYRPSPLRSSFLARRVVSSIRAQTNLCSERRPRWKPREKWTKNGRRARKRFSTTTTIVSGRFTLAPAYKWKEIEKGFGVRGNKNEGNNRAIRQRGYIRQGNRRLSIIEEVSSAASGSSAIQLSRKRVTWFFLNEPFKDLFEASIRGRKSGNS